MGPNPREFPDVVFIGCLTSYLNLFTRLIVSYCCSDDGVSPLDVERANAVFKQVGEAYSVLSDATSKSRFDRELREHYASQTRVHMGGGAGGVYYTSTHSFNTSSFTSSFYGGGRGRSRRY